MTKPKVPKALLAKIKYHKDKIAAHRDALREIMEDVEAVVDSTDDAVQQIEYGIETLSQYV